MKKPIRTLSIPNPCHESWDNMIPMLNGKYCQSCSRVVVDFSRMSDREIIIFFKNYQGKTCGNFRSDQINRELHPASLELPIPIRKVAATMLVSALAAGSTTAQEHTLLYHKSQELNMASVIRPQMTESHSSDMRTISGRVVEYGTDEPLIGANVVIKASTVGTVTDFDGNFQLKIPDDLARQVTLNVSYVGFEPSEILIDASQQSIGNMCLKSGVELGEVVIVGYTVPTVRGGPVGYSVISADEKQEVAEATDVEPAEAIVPALQVSPNPFHQALRAEFQNMIKGAYQLYLIDMSGKEIWSGTLKLDKGPNTVILNFPTELINGSYILHVNSKYGQLNANLVRQSD